MALKDRASSYAAWRMGRAHRSIQAAKNVDQPLRFLLRDALPRRSSGAYTVGGRWQVELAHSTQDVSIFQEIFNERYYALDPELEHALGPSPFIVDLGGNIGMYALWVAATWPAAQVVAYEPDAVNAAKYRRLLTLNALSWQVVEACAASADGTLRFATGEESESRIVEDSGGIEVPAQDVFPDLARADVLKMDIEGGEWDIMLDPRFPGIAARVILMEYHAHLCPGGDPRGLAESTLRDAGYEVESIMHDDGYGMFRAIRR